MPQELTEFTRLQAEKGNQEPQLVFKIEGHDRLFGAVEILKFIRIGDPDLFIDGSWIIGGRRPHENQAPWITFKQGTSNSMSQQLDQDVGEVSSVTTFTVRLIDKDQEITKLISPGFVLEDILGRRAKVYVGYGAGAFPEDYVEIHAGTIDDVNSGAGYVDMVVSHPEQKKRQELFFKVESELAADIDEEASALELIEGTDMSRVLAPVIGPDGESYDDSIEFFVRIDDEFIKYTGVLGTSLSGLSRGQLGSAAAAHAAGARVETVIKLEGTAMELALKLMLSGRNGDSVTGVKVSAFLYDIPETDHIGIGRVVKISGVDVRKVYQIRPGDFISTTGSAEEANNFTLQKIEDIVFLSNEGSYILLESHEVVREWTTEATCSFRSQYDCLGHGLAMSTEEVDVNRHLLLYERYLSSFKYRFILRDTIEAQEFISKEIYKPAACYSLPRGGKVSVGIHAPPLPIDEVKILNEKNIQKPSDIVLKRSLNRNFFNTISYKFDEDPVTGDFRSRKVADDAGSLTRIPVGAKVLEVEALGLRSDLNAKNLINLSNERRFNRYKHGAEHIENVELNFGPGFPIEVGDIVVLDPENLSISDTKKGTRNKDPKFFEVSNKTQTLSPGGVKVSLVDTNFSTQSRYGLISPSSLVREGISQREFTIKASFAKKFLSNEWQKWKRFEGVGVVLRVRSPDGATRVGQAALVSVLGNLLKLDADLGFVPVAGDLVQLAPYNNQVELTKLLYTFMSDTDFDDGKQQYNMF